MVSGIPCEWLGNIELAQKPAIFPVLSGVRRLYDVRLWLNGVWIDLWRALLCFWLLYCDTVTFLEGWGWANLQFCAIKLLFLSFHLFVGNEPFLVRGSRDQFLCCCTCTWGAGEGDGSNQGVLGVDLVSSCLPSVVCV